MIKITIDTQYQCNQFDDWLAGGQIEYKSKKYYWCDNNSNYGFGWEIEPITDNDWDEISEMSLIKLSP